jgi:hypothetical protein
MSNKRLYVRDDLGHAWYLDTSYGALPRIVMVGDDSYPKNQRGYICDNFEHGVRLLNEHGYITGKEKATK